jgi:hypothetical protein
MAVMADMIMDAEKVMVTRKRSISITTTKSIRLIRLGAGDLKRGCTFSFAITPHFHSHPNSRLAGGFFHFFPA